MRYLQYGEQYFLPVFKWQSQKGIGWIHWCNSAFFMYSYICGGFGVFFFFDLRVFTGLFILQVSGVLYYIGAQRAWLLAFYLVSHGVCWRMPVEREGWDLKLQIWTGKIPSCFEGICFSCLQGCMFFLKVCLWKRASAEAGDVTRFNLICKIEHEL